MGPGQDENLPTITHGWSGTEMWMVRHSITGGRAGDPKEQDNRRGQQTPCLPLCLVDTVWREKLLRG